MNRILIIDDDKELCVLIKRSVLSEDIEADFCNTGKEGLRKLKEKEYQLVILDVMMPGMDGFETMKEIRKENSLPILMFTSKNDNASKVCGLRAGADDYLTKPFDMDELIARIISLIRRYTRFNQSDGMTQKLEFDGLHIDIENRSITTENGTFELPPKEFDLLLWDFAYLTEQVIKNNMSMIFPMCISLIAGYMISREQTDDTLKNILTVPISFKRLLTGKLIVCGVLSIIFGCCMNCGYTMRSNKQTDGRHYLQCSNRHVAKDACIGSFIGISKFCKIWCLAHQII